MATYIEQGTYAPTADKQVMSCAGAIAYTLTSGADGTALTGTGDIVFVSSDESGWLHISSTAGTDKAAAGKTFRILAGLPRPIGGVGKGMFVSFLQAA